MRRKISFAYSAIPEELRLRRYVDYYAQLPLPRALKPFAPWIMSIAMLMVVFAFSAAFQWCVASGLHGEASTGNAPHWLKQLLKAILRAF